MNTIPDQFVWDDYALNTEGGREPWFSPSALLRGCHDKALPSRCFFPAQHLETSRGSSWARKAEEKATKTELNPFLTAGAVIRYPRVQEWPHTRCREQLSCVQDRCRQALVSCHARSATCRSCPEPLTCTAVRPWPLILWVPPQLFLHKATVPI